MQKMNMKRIAEFIKGNFQSDEKVILVLEGPVNKNKHEQSFGCDTAEWLIKTLTDPEVCDVNEDLFYATIGKAYLLEGRNITKGS